MDFSFSSINPDYLVIAGSIGTLLGLFFLLIFIYRRIRWLIGIISKNKSTSPGLIASLRHFIFILLWAAVFGMLLFWGFFMRAYHVLTFEEPVAEIITNPIGQEQSQITLIQFTSREQRTSESIRNTELVRHFTIRGDQWMLEGDILKWDSWLNFLGVHTMYRLTRLRGRYLNTMQEIQNEATIYSLVPDENRPCWQYLYKFGPKMPFVSTVYGNAAFQALGTDRRFLIYVSTSGFVVREKEPTKTSSTD